MEDESDFLDDRDDLPKLRELVLKMKKKTQRDFDQKEDFEASEWNEVEDEMTSRARC